MSYNMNSNKNIDLDFNSQKNIQSEFNSSNQIQSKEEIASQRAIQHFKNVGSKFHSMNQKARNLQYKNTLDKDYIKETTQQTNQKLNKRKLSKSISRSQEDSSQVDEKNQQFYKSSLSSHMGSDNSMEDASDSKDEDSYFRLNISTSSEENNLQNSYKSITQENNIEKDAQEIMQKIIKQNSQFHFNTNHTHKKQLTKIVGYIKNDKTPIKNQKQDENLQQNLDFQNNKQEKQQNQLGISHFQQNNDKLDQEDKWENTQYLRTLSQNQDNNKNINISERSNNNKIIIKMQVNDFLTFQRLQHEQDELKRMYDQFQKNGEQMLGHIQRTELIEKQQETEKQKQNTINQNNENDQQLVKNLAKKLLKGSKAPHRKNDGSEGLKKLFGTGMFGKNLQSNSESEQDEMQGLSLVQRIKITQKKQKQESKFKKEQYKIRQQDKLRWRTPCKDF